MRFFIFLFTVCALPAFAQQTGQPEFVPTATVTQAVQEIQAEQKADLYANSPPGLYPPTPTLVPRATTNIPSVPSSASGPPPIPAPVLSTPLAPAVADVPEISFGQKVDMVVTAKYDPRILDVKIDQTGPKLMVNVVVDKNQDQEEIKEIANTLIRQIKSKSLDDLPKDKKEPGKGLYDYQLNFSHPDGVNLLTAYKLAKETILRFESPVPMMQPVTRVDAVGR